MRQSFWFTCADAVQFFLEPLKCDRDHWRYRVWWWLLMRANDCIDYEESK